MEGMEVHLDRRFCDPFVNRRLSANLPSRLGLAQLLPGTMAMGKVQLNATVDQILGAAIAVHRKLGPGLLESTYEHTLAYELTTRSVPFVRQVAVPVHYGEVQLPRGFRADFIVNNEVLVEIKSVRCLMPIHSAQILTYLKLTGKPRGLLINFNVKLLKDGIRSFLNS